MLVVDDLVVQRAGKPVLHKVSVRLRTTEKIALLGHNGAGKSTLLQAILGLLTIDSGTVELNDHDITALDAHQVVSRGISLVPQNNGCFVNLTVAENLRFAARTDSAITLPDVFELFSILADRRGQIAGTMSGGERQMVAIAMALLAGPQILLLDEPSIGLAPKVVDEVMAAVDRAHTEFGVGILLVEQNVVKAAEFADHIYVLNQGQIIRDGSSAEILSGDLWELV